MAEGDESTEKTVQESYRLPAGLVRYIDQLKDMEVLGTTKSAVVRTLLNNAIQALDRENFVGNHLKSVELLKKLKRSKTA